MKKLIIPPLILLFAFPVFAQNPHTLPGDWKGSITIMGNPLPITTHFTGDDSLTGSIKIQDATLPLQNIRTTATDSVFFQFTTSVNVARFKGSFENDSIITGNYYQANQKFSFKLNRNVLKAEQQNSNDNITAGQSNDLTYSTLAGYWKGHFSDSTSFKTHFKYKKDKYKGNITIQSQQVPLSQIYTTKDDSVFFYFAPNGGAHFKGAFQNDTLITGDYYQNGGHLRFKLNRYKSIIDTHESEKPKPYHHKDLIIKNDSISIGGTLTWPKDKKAGQLVIMISGSGAQDRNESLGLVTDFEPFAVLADSLTNSGLATFRFDDRGVGQSTGNFGNATLDILADDVDAIIEHFTNQSDKNFDEIVLLGHSQGGIVGSKVAANNGKVGKLVLMASTAADLDDIVEFQLKQSFENSGFKKAEIDVAVSAFLKTLKTVHDGNNAESLKKDFKTKFIKMFKTLPDEKQTQMTNIDSTAKVQAQILLGGFTSPQMQSLLYYNPTDDLEQLSIPVLALFGGKDTQVTVEINKKPMTKALRPANTSAMLKVFEDANHLFQKAETGLGEEYGRLESRFVDGFTSTIADWIKK